MPGNTDPQECEDDSIEKTLANPNHPIWKAILGIVALLTVIYGQQTMM